ncbi:pH-response regulator protein-like protein palC [Lineolata rhizophorae]|uniref:pH-response regulator protein palC n=1 Tax=Lineolata rhizophorae TaxID=578093 RepID=A0A6A6NYH1_9PEZI|nr:pH-response regulator protein-like protein palC [Lineolata rhizophorae]
MPFPFVLPTASSLSFADFFASSTHPSLPLAATTGRAIVRDALKRHKRLPPPSRPADLPAVLDALNSYLPYLLALDAGLGGSPVGGEEVDVALLKELEVEWRPTLTASVPGREPPRQRLRSIDSEIAFVLSTLGFTYSLLARARLRTLYDATIPTDAQRAAAISAAMKHFLDANSAHAHALARSSQWTSAPPAADILTSTQSALASLTLAEATLIAVLKDDPYPAVVAEDRNEASKDWMFKSPSIPKVRAHLFAHLCLAAAEHAAKGLAVLRGTAGGRLDDALPKYLDDLRRTARGKACRFLGIDAELAGKTGEGIAWLRAAKKELGFATAGSDDDRKKMSGFSKFKKEWAERREDRKIEKGGAWGSDAGRFEEGRVLDMLEKKWVKMNDTVNVQVVPPSEPLVASMPSGREYHTPKPFKAPNLDEDALARMRAPPDPCDAAAQGGEADSSDDENAAGSDPVGAFPGTKAQYSGESSYY